MDLPKSPVGKLSTSAVRDILSSVHLGSAVGPSPVAAVICPVDEGIVFGTKMLPLVRDRVRCWHVRDILSKDNGEASIQMPIDVAMEEPWSRVVGEETDCDFISRVANTHDISDDSVVEVVGRVTSAADDVEVMPM